MSCCCPREDPQYKYEVKMTQDGQESYKYVNSLQELDPLFREQENVSITKVKTQVGLLDLKNQMKSTNQKFTDSLFPPNQTSLGNHVPNSNWKRIPELIKYQKPCLFDRKIQPSDVISGHTGDCYLLSSLAALAEYPDIIRKIFRGQKENDEGIYRVNLRVNGVVEEVVIDDFVPAQQNGNAVFCQPNRKTGEFWVVLLEKALAKVKGSYSNLNQGTPSDIFRMVTYAPSESMVFSNEHQQQDKIWAILQQYTKNPFPFCASTHNHSNEAQGLEKTHTYTIISAMELLDNNNRPVRVVKLRNPWKAVDYHGRGSISDASFWGSIPDTQAKSAFFANNNNCDYGLFYMTFQDFCLNFNQIHFCNLDGGGKFISQNLLIGKKASFYDVSIQRQGIYTLQLNHSGIKGQTKQQEETEGTGRSTLLLIKKEKGDMNTYKFHFVNGTMRYNQSNLMMTEKLSPGEYVIYAKVEPPFNSTKFPQTAVINLYSKLFANLQPVLRTKYPNLLRDTFITHAQQNKKAVYEEGRIWLSWQLLVEKGGFGYIAAGDSRDSKQSVIINLSQQQFHAENFKLKKPFKGLGQGQQVRIKPGQQNIIILRVLNNPSIRSIKLPANIDIRLEPLYR